MYGIPHAMTMCAIVCAIFLRACVRSDRRCFGKSTWSVHRQQFSYQINKNMENFTSIVRRVCRMYVLVCCLLSALTVDGPPYIFFFLLIPRTEECLLQTIFFPSKNKPPNVEGVLGTRNDGLADCVNDARFREIHHHSPRKSILIFCNRRRKRQSLSVCICKNIPFANISINQFNRSVLD